MLYLILGIIIGLVGAVIFAFAGAIFVARFQKEIEDAVEAVEEGKLTPFKEKAEFFEPISPEVEAMEAAIKENEKKGRDTEMKDLG